MKDLKNQIIQTAMANPSTGDLKKVSGVAYSGGTIAQPWTSIPLVVDLGGMSFAAQIPLLENHANSPDARIGVVEAAVRDGTLEVSGGIDTETERGKALAEAGARIPWQLSIGASIDEYRFVDEKETAEANGRTFHGPLYLVAKSTLREVSVVAVGADAETSLSIAAGLAAPKAEAESQKPEVAASAPASVAEPPAPASEIAASAPVATIEAARQALGAVPVPSSEFLARAVAAGWTPIQTLQAALEMNKMDKKYDEVPTNIVVKAAPQNDAAWLRASMGLRAGLDGESLEKVCGAPAVEAADKSGRDMTLRDYVMAACRIDGHEQTRFGNEAIRAAFSSQTFGAALASTATTRALKAFGAQPGIATRLCSEGDLADFKVSDRYRINAIGDLEKVTEGGEIKHGVLGADMAHNQLGTYGRSFVITREMIYNDSLGEFLRIPTALGAKAKRKIDQLFFARLLSNPTQGDSVALFHTDHNNKATGAGSALAAAGLAAAVAKLYKQTDADGNPIGVDPKFLVVPPELHAKAMELVYAEVIGGTTNVQRRYGLEVVSAPYLSNPTLAGYSATGWYLFADPPLCDTFEIGYLNGRRVPTVEQTSVDFDTLGLGFRVYFDVGVREQDYRGMVFSAGA